MPSASTKVTDAMERMTVEITVMKLDVLRRTTRVKKTSSNAEIRNVSAMHLYATRMTTVVTTLMNQHIAIRTNVLRLRITSVDTNAWTPRPHFIVSVTQDTS
jgi:hypothetical protein